MLLTHGEMLEIAHRPKHSSGYDPCIMIGVGFSIVERRDYRKCNSGNSFICERILLVVDWEHSVVGAPTRGQLSCDVRQHTRGR